MPASLRQLRERRASVSTIKKLTRAMELIAASRIVKAQQRAQAAGPYARELTRAVSAVATFSSVDHPLTTEPEDPKRAAVLVVTGAGTKAFCSGADLKHVDGLLRHEAAQGAPDELEVVDDHLAQPLLRTPRRTCIIVEIGHGMARLVAVPVFADPPH